MGSISLQFPSSLEPKKLHTFWQMVLVYNGIMWLWSLPLYLHQMPTALYLLLGVHSAILRHILLMELLSTALHLLISHQKRLTVTRPSSLGVPQTIMRGNWL